MATPGVPNPPPAAARALAGVLLARAAELAREGRLEAAASLALHGAAAHDGPAALDLLARIRAQQGRRADAEASWTEVLRREPGHAGAVAGLRRLAAPPARTGLVVAAGAVVLAAAAALLVSRDGARPSPAAVPVPQSIPPTRSAPARPDPLAALDLEVPGASVAAAPGARIVGFPGGLFTRGVELRPEARAALQELGRRLAADRLLSLEVIGHADDRTLRAEVAYRDNAGLGLARAAVAADVVREAGGLAADRVALRYAGDAPRGLDPAARRARRTVEFRVSAP